MKELTREVARRLDRRTRSIRRTTVIAGIGFTVILVIVFLLFARSAGSMRTELARATATVVEEQRIARRLVRAVTRQLVTASQFAVSQNDALMTRFRRTGEEVYTEIRRYLARNLTPAQRIELEEVREEHQRFEVAANQAFDMFATGRTDEATASADAMVGHALSLQDALDEFLIYRERDLERLRDRQATIFRFVYAGVGVVALLLLLGIVQAGRYLHLRMGRPIRELTSAALAIERGDMDTRVDMPYDDEFAEVGAAFNQMADSLAAARASVESRNRQLRNALDELRATQAELIQSEKMSATGRMMAGLAHELNNPLASILGYGELLGSRLQQDEPLERESLRDLAGPIVAEAGRARGLVRNLLRFARRSDGEISAVPLRDALQVVVRLRSYAFQQAGLRLEVDEVPECHVRAEEQRMQQVFLNIVNNAFDAMEPNDDGVLTVSAAGDGDRVVVRFEDDGPGFVEPDRVFEPFYTTKPVGQGTGLGLSLVHRFMEEFGGAVRAENREGSGARIVLEFRTARAEDAAPSAGEARTVAPPDGGDVRILVVEDEQPLRELQRRLLARIHADVLVASAVDEATHILQDEDVDLVVSDVKMPGASGIELFRWVQQNRPALAERFLFVTGDIGDPEIAAFAEAEPERFVHKPFQMADYLQRVAEAL